MKKRSTNRRSKRLAPLALIAVACQCGPSVLEIGRVDTGGDDDSTPGDASSTEIPPVDAGGDDGSTPGDTSPTGQPDSDPPNPCADIECSGHGACVVSNGSATCDCASGYEPSGLACVPVPSDLTFIRTTDGETDPDDYDEIGEELPKIGYREVGKNASVTGSALRTYFTSDVTLLYHTGHGFSGGIAARNGDFEYTDIDALSPENSFIATCETLSDDGWMSKFGPRTNTFSGYTKDTWSSGDIPVLRSYIQHLENGDSFAMAFYMAHVDTDYYLDRWCIYARVNGSVVEYSARSGDEPRGKNAARIQLDDDGKLFANESLISTGHAKVSYGAFELGPINTTTRAGEFGLIPSAPTSISENEAVEIAFRYVNGSWSEGAASHDTARFDEPDQVLDRVMPITLRQGRNAASEIGAWEVRFAKQMPDGLTVRSNAQALHMTVNIAGDGVVTAFRKRWAPTTGHKSSAIEQRGLLSVSEALTRAAPDISKNITRDSRFAIVDWVPVHGLDADGESASATVRPAYRFLTECGTGFVVDAFDGSVL